MNDLDHLPADLQQLLQLFSALPDVRFPELDAASLQTAVARVKDRQLELAALEAQRELLRAALDEDQEALLKKGHRLHAYLRVFAESDEALAAKVNAVSLPRLRKPVLPRVEPVAADGTPPPPPRKRGRPRKVPATDALFAEPPAAPAP